MKTITHQQLQSVLSDCFTNYQTKELSLKTPRQSGIQLRVDRYEDFIVTCATIEASEQPIRFEACRDEPFIMMIFHLTGNIAIERQRMVFPGNHCSLSFLPRFASPMTVKPHEKLQKIVIKLDLAFVEQYLTKQDEFTRWFFEQIVHERPFDTLDSAKMISPEIRNILLHLLECEFEGTLRQLYLESQIKLLLSLLIYEFQQSATKTKKIDQLNATDIEVLHEIEQYISQHYLDDLSLYRITRTFGINEFKLKYGFRQLFGISPMKLAQRKRMAHAREQLLRSDKLVSDIALELGYSSTANFSNAFRHFYGCAPSAVR